ncbi:MAG: hypothetical protein ACI4ES_05075 [Roseburia sp.]
MEEEADRKIERILVAAVERTPFKMARRKHRKHDYKFTEKTQSKRGMLALGLAILSLVIFVIVIINASSSGGNGSMYLGSAGVSSMLLAVVALVLAIRSLFEEESFKIFPYLSTVFSVLVAGIWIILYVVGFFLA